MSKEKIKLDADKARTYLAHMALLEFKEIVEEWVADEAERIQYLAMQAMAPMQSTLGDPLKYLGQAKGLQLVSDRIKSLKFMCQRLVDEEIKKLKAAENQQGIGTGKQFQSKGGPDAQKGR